MKKNINVRINDEQINKINSSGLSCSEYVRKSIDFYDKRKDNALSYIKIEIIHELMDKLKSIEEKEYLQISSKTQYKNAKYVNNQDSFLYDNWNNVKNIYENNNFSLQNVQTPQADSLYEKSESVKTMTDDPLFNTYKNYLPLLSKMLNIHGTVLEHAKKKISGETGTTKRQLSKFILEYQEEIKEIEYEFTRVNSS